MASKIIGGAKKNPSLAMTGPSHVAIIMDGNGRWANRLGIPRILGHRAGTERIRRVLQVLAAEGVAWVTVYAFSTENWGRPSGEVKGLLNLMSEVIQNEVPRLHEENVRIRHLGSLKRVSSHLAKAISRAQHLTEANTGMTLCVGFDYGGRAEIVEAVRQIIDQGITAENVTEETIRKYLSLPDVPDPDLIIRTAGEQRLSNFMLWQAAYSEMYYTDAFWPDFDEDEVRKALDWYKNRRRRFGRLPSEL